MGDPGPGILLNVMRGYSFLNSLPGNESAGVGKTKWNTIANKGGKTVSTKFDSNSVRANGVANTVTNGSRNIVRPNVSNAVSKSVDAKGRRAVTRRTFSNSINTDVYPRDSALCSARSSRNKSVVGNAEFQTEAGIVGAKDLASIRSYLECANKGENSCFADQRPQSRIVSSSDEAMVNSVMRQVAELNKGKLSDESLVKVLSSIYRDAMLRITSKNERPTEQTVSSTTASSYLPGPPKVSLILTETSLQISTELKSTTYSQLPDTGGSNQATQPIISDNPALTDPPVFMSVTQRKKLQWEKERAELALLEARSSWAGMHAVKPVLNERAVQPPSVVPSNVNPVALGEPVSLSTLPPMSVLSTVSNGALPALTPMAFAANEQAEIMKREEQRRQWRAELDEQIRQQRLMEQMKAVEERKKSEALLQQIQLQRQMDLTNTAVVAPAARIEPSFASTVGTVSYPTAHAMDPHPSASHFAVSSYVPTSSNSVPAMADSLDSRTANLIPAGTAIVTPGVLHPVDESTKTTFNRTRGFTQQIYENNADSAERARRTYEISMANLQQIEEKRRQREEEKARRLLEDKLEEERVAAERARLQAIAQAEDAQRLKKEQEQQHISQQLIDDLKKAREEAKAYRHQHLRNVQRPKPTAELKQTRKYDQPRLDSQKCRDDDRGRNGQVKSPSFSSIEEERSPYSDQALPHQVPTVSSSAVQTSANVEIQTVVPEPRGDRGYLVPKQRQSTTVPSKSNNSIRSQQPGRRTSAAVGDTRATRPTPTRTSTMRGQNDRTPVNQSVTGTRSTRVKSQAHPGADVADSDYRSDAYEPNRTFSLSKNPSKKFTDDQSNEKSNRNRTLPPNAPSLRRHSDSRIWNGNGSKNERSRVPSQDPSLHHPSHIPVPVNTRSMPGSAQTERRTVNPPLNERNYSCVPPIPSVFGPIGLVRTDDVLIPPNNSDHGNFGAVNNGLGKNLSADPLLNPNVVKERSIARQDTILQRLSEIRKNSETMKIRICFSYLVLGFHVGKFGWVAATYLKDISVSMRIRRITYKLCCYPVLLLIRSVKRTRVNTLIRTTPWVILIVLFTFSAWQFCNVLLSGKISWPTQTGYHYSVGWHPPVHALPYPAWGILDLWPVYIAHGSLSEKGVTFVIFSSLSPFPHATHLKDPRSVFAREHVQQLLSLVLQGAVNRVVWIYPYWFGSYVPEFHKVTRYDVGVVALSFSSDLFQPIQDEITRENGGSEEETFTTVCLCESQLSTCNLPLFFANNLSISRDACLTNASVTFEEVIDLLAESLLTPKSITTSETYLPAARPISYGWDHLREEQTTPSDPWFPDQNEFPSTATVVILISSDYFDTNGLSSALLTTESQSGLNVNKLTPAVALVIRNSTLISEWLVKIRSLFEENLATTTSTLSDPANSEAALRLTQVHLDTLFLLLPPRGYEAAFAHELQNSSVPPSCANHPTLPCRTSPSSLTPEQRAVWSHWRNLLTASESPLTEEQCDKRESLIFEVLQIVLESDMPEGELRQLWRWLCRLSGQDLYLLSQWTLCIHPAEHLNDSASVLLSACERGPPTASSAHSFEANEADLLLNRMYSIFKHLKPTFFTVVSPPPSTSSEEYADAFARLSTSLENIH
ncbi:unnamed protein product [Calicophoron daubneyi]|uniref:Uncharacterized protein n=1 Tax=Calicophoron daubneyi TaxID=300641 RepID=A0AAV2TQW7_CALDB